MPDFTDPETQRRILAESKRLSPQGELETEQPNSLDAPAGAA